MADVAIRDVVEEVVQHRREGPIDRAKCAAEPVPLLGAVVGHEDVRVLQVGDHDQPVVHPHVWHPVVLQDLHDPELAAAEGEHADHQEHAHVGAHNVKVLLLRKKRRVGVEVVASLSGVLVRPRGVQEEVARHPPNREHGEEPPQHHQRHVAHQVAVFLVVVVAARRAEDLVVLAAAGVGVVVAVADAPAVVGHEQCGVQHPADGVVHKLGRAEGLVAALVRDDPDAGANGPLPKPVGHPKQRPSPKRQSARVDVARAERHRAGDDEVDRQVLEGLHHATLEEVPGNRLLDRHKIELRRPLQRHQVRRSLVCDAGCIRRKSQQEILARALRVDGAQLAMLAQLCVRQRR
mmetsp:Transcript_17392/g.66240  ORF Transcript_17392/g.66240 Transcript_17392/m.66240 type:complete len:349 (-) Transcript_17392:165-1211(-)